MPQGGIDDGRRGRSKPRCASWLRKRAFRPSSGRRHRAQPKEEHYLRPARRTDRQALEGQISRAAAVVVPDALQGRGQRRQHRHRSPRIFRMAMGRAPTELPGQLIVPFKKRLYEGAGGGVWGVNLALHVSSACRRAVLFQALQANRTVRCPESSARTDVRQLSSLVRDFFRPLRPTTVGLISSALAWSCGFSLGLVSS